MEIHPLRPLEPSPGDRPVRRFTRRSLNPTERRDDVTRRPSFAILSEDMGRVGGNTVPIFAGRPKPDGTRDVLDGNSRFYAAEDNGIDELLGIEVDEDLDEAGLIEFSAQVNGVRRVMTPEQWGRQGERLMQLTGCTQDEAARRLRISPAAMSRGLATLLMPERHQARAAKLHGSIRAIIAAEPDGQVQDALIEFAATAGPGGKLPSRDAVELRQKQLRGGKAKGRPRKHLEVKTAQGSVVESIKLRADASPILLAQQLRALAGIVDKHADDGMKVVLALIEGRKLPEPPASPATA